MCICIVEIWFGIANGQISSIFDKVICPLHYVGRVLLFHVFIFLFDRNCIGQNFAMNEMKIVIARLLHRSVLPYYIFIIETVTLMGCGAVHPPT